MHELLDPADDAELIDTTDLSVEEVAARIEGLVEAARARVA